MPAWLLPVVKFILPHVGNIVTAAKPVFTKLKGEAADQAALVQRQIVELQAAASDNATYVKELAEQLRLTVEALEQGARDAEKRMRKAYGLALTAAILSVIAFGVAIYALLR